MAAWYLPAAEETAVGGDWYDVIELGHRRLGSDDRGRGRSRDGRRHLHGAAAQRDSRVRARRRRARRRCSPSSRDFSDQQHSRMATMIYATLNLDTWVVGLRARRPSIPAADPRRREADVPAPTRVGRRSARAAGGLRRAAHHARGGGDPGALHGRADRAPRAAALGGGGGARRGRGRGPGRARAQVSVDHERPHRGRSRSPTTSRCSPCRAVGLHEQLEVEVPADAEQLATVRHLIRRWVAANGGTDDDCAAFAIAVTEACANAVEHAYGPGDAMIDLSAGPLEDGDATVTVRDRGRLAGAARRQSRAGHPGHEEFMDDVAIDTGDEGTTVELRRSHEAGRVRPELARLSVESAGRRRAGPRGRRGRRLERGRPERSGCSTPSPTGPAALVIDLTRDQLHRQLRHQPDLRRGGAHAKPPSAAAAGGHAAVVRRRGARRGVDGGLGCRSIRPWTTHSGCRRGGRRERPLAVSPYRVWPALSMTLSV